MYCPGCGKPIEEDSLFCRYCGRKISPAPAAITDPPLNINETTSIAKNTASTAEYTGEANIFRFMGKELHISPEMDVFNHYRREYKKKAAEMSNLLNKDYSARIFDLDSYFEQFPIIYRTHLEVLTKGAFATLIANNVYDLPYNNFYENHIADFCLAQADYDKIIDSFNQTIKNNQNKIIDTYNYIPGMVFSGLGGFITATAVNIAASNIVEDTVKKANVSPSQRAELYSRIDHNAMIADANIDYWRVFLSMTYQLNIRNYPVWYPTVENNQKANGLFNNIVSGTVPREKHADILIEIFQLMPFSDDLFGYINTYCGENSDIDEINRYFGCFDKKHV